LFYILLEEMIVKILIWKVSLHLIYRT
jgi:hypothetical protein